jgi:exopolyphosphatase / guanosine-5'-triphosphate,3'-diphosphate pyrophosphatase
VTVSEGATRTATIGPVVAALDCGTNSTRLLISDADGRILDRQMRVTRLGEGVDTNRKLSGEAIERTLAVLRDYKTRMDAKGVRRARMVATSAARDAVNASEFMTAARDVTGVEPELLSGPEEGLLSFMGATADLPAPSGGSVQPAEELVVDIGGGSTELVLGTAGDGESVRLLSLDIGCVRVTERFLYSDPPTDDELSRARVGVAAEVTRAVEHLGAGQGERLIGLAGTVSTLGSLALGLAEYERDRVHHSVLTSDQVGSWLSRLASEPTRVRAGLPGMEPARADVIVGGVLILSEVMARFRRKKCLVSEADILDGIAAGLR